MVGQIAHDERERKKGWMGDLVFETRCLLESHGFQSRSFNVIPRDPLVSNLQEQQSFLPATILCPFPLSGDNS